MAIEAARVAFQALGHEPGEMPMLKEMLQREGARNAHGYPFTSPTAGIPKSA